MSIFWNTIQPIMAYKKITQVDIARTLGKEKSTVNHWIKFDRIPPADYALKIADLLGVDLRYLVEGKKREEYYYDNKELKPVIDLLSDKDQETIRDACINVKAALEIRGLYKENSESTAFPAADQKTKDNAG